MKVDDLRDYFKNKNFEIMDCVLLHTICGIAMHPQLTSSIDVEFSQNHKEYFQAYRKSHYYEKNFFNLFPATYQVNIIKLTSIYVWNEQNQLGSGKDILIRYIIDGYKRIYDYVTQQKVLSLGSLISFYIERYHGTVSEPMQSFLGAIALYLSSDEILNKEIMSVPNDPILRTLLYNMFINYRGEELSKSEFFVSEKNKNEMSSLQNFQEIIGAKLAKDDTIDNVFSKHEDKLSNSLSRKEKENLVRNGDFSALYKLGLYRYWKPLTALLRAYEINEMLFSLVPFTRNDMNNIYTFFELSKDAERLKEEEYEFFFASCLCVLMLTKRYKELQNEYLSLFEYDSGIKELEESEQIKKLQQLFYQREKEKDSEIVTLKRNVSFLEQQVDDLKRSYKESETTDEEFYQLKKEVIALRDFVFSEKNRETKANYEEKTDKLDISQLENKKIAIIGGHQKWHQKIKEILPSVRTVHPDETNIDLSFIRNMDLVCIETSYNNHTLYQRSLFFLDKKETKILYLNQQQNVKSFIKQISEMFNQS